MIRYGLPQKRLLWVCALTIALAEGPMLALKCAYRVEFRGGLLAALSIALSLIYLYRALVYKAIMLVTQFRIDRSARRGAGLALRGEQGYAEQGKGAIVGPSKSSRRSSSKRSTSRSSSECRRTGSSDQMHVGEFSGASKQRELARGASSSCSLGMWAGEV